MSAFLVSKKHIDVLVQASPDFRGMTSAERNDLGRMLWRENMLSLAARYRDPIDEEMLASYAFALVMTSTSPIAAIKAVHCYAYQSHEHDGWEVSKAKAYCDALVNSLTHEIPGYDAAPWGIE